MAENSPTKPKKNKKIQGSKIFWQNLLAGRLLPFVISLLCLSLAAGGLWFYLPNSKPKVPSYVKNKLFNDNPRQISQISDGRNSDISNYVVLEYWEQQKKYHEAGKFYGTISQWLSEDKSFQGRAFLGYLRIGDYQKAAAFLGILENITTKNNSEYPQEIQNLLSNIYPENIHLYRDWENVYHALIQIKSQNYSQAQKHISAIQTQNTILQNIAIIIQYLIVDQLTEAEKSATNHYKINQSLQASLLISRLAMQHDWQNIVVEVEKLQRNEQISQEIQKLYFHALYHLDRGDEALKYISEFAPAYDIKSLFFADMKQNIITNNLSEISQDPADYIAEHLAEFAASFSQKERFDGVSLVLIRLGLYLTPHHDKLQSTLANIFTQQKDLETAIAIRNQALASDEDIPLHAEISHKLLLSNLYNFSEKDQKKQSITILRDLQKQYPKFYQFYLYEGNIHRVNGDYKKALKLYNKAFANLPIQINAEIFPTFSDLKQIITQGENAPFLQRAEIKPWQRFSQLFYIRGILYSHLNKWDHAEKDLMLAVAFGSKEANILNHLGYIWADAGVNIEQAIFLLEYAVTLSHNPHIIDSLGWAYYRQGDYQRAANILEIAIIGEPNNAIVNDHLGDVYWELGIKRDANFQWQRALKLETDSKNIATIKAKLRDNF